MKHCAVIVTLMQSVVAVTIVSWRLQPDERGKSWMCGFIGSILCCGFGFVLARLLRAGFFV
jgi:hypothetical protein